MCACDPKRMNYRWPCESDPAQNRYLTEGACPNRCGPLIRMGEYEAMCKCCKFAWKSNRVAMIFPKE